MTTLKDALAAAALSASLVIAPTAALANSPDTSHCQDLAIAAKITCISKAWDSHNETVAERRKALAIPQKDCMDVPAQNYDACMGIPEVVRPPTPPLLIVRSRPKFRKIDRPKFRKIDSQSPVDCRKLKGGKWKAYEPLMDAIGWECYDANNKTHAKYVQKYPSAAARAEKSRRIRGYTSRPSSGYSRSPSGRFSRTCSVSTVETSTGYSTTLTCY